jgi:hypothetical protein
MVIHRDGSTTPPAVEPASAETSIGDRREYRKYRKFNSPRAGSASNPAPPRRRKRVAEIAESAESAEIDGNEILQCTLG